MSLRDSCPPSTRPAGKNPQEGGHRDDASGQFQLLMSSGISFPLVPTFGFQLSAFTSPWAFPGQSFPTWAKPPPGNGARSQAGTVFLPSVSHLTALFFFLFQFHVCLFSAVLKSFSLLLSLPRLTVSVSPSPSLVRGACLSVILPSVLRCTRAPCLPSRSPS